MRNINLLIWGVFVFTFSLKAQTNANIFHWDYSNEAVITSSYTNSLDNLTDKDETTIYTVANSSNMDVEFEFEYPLFISGFLVYSGNIQQPINISNVQLLASNDRQSWTTAAKTVDSDPAKSLKGQAGQVTRVDLESKGSFKYFKLQYSSQNNISLAEFQLFGYPGITGGNYPADLIQVDINEKDTNQENAVGTNGTYSFSDNGITGDSYIEVASRAVDGIKNKYTVNGTSLWIQYDFLSEVIVEEFSIAIGATSNMDRNPRDFRLLASDNWGITWKTIAEYNGFEFPACNYTNMRFPVSNARDYLYYRLEVTANNGGDKTHLSEFQLLGIVPSYSSDKTIKSVFKINVYSNNQNLIIENSESEKLICNIFNLQGSQVTSFILNDSRVEVPLNKGLYILEFKSIDTEKVFRTKVVNH